MSNKPSHLTDTHTIRENTWHWEYAPPEATEYTESNSIEVHGSLPDPEFDQQFDAAVAGLLSPSDASPPPALLPDHLRPVLQRFVAEALMDTASPERAAILEQVQRALGDTAAASRQRAFQALRDSASKEGCSEDLVVVGAAELAAVLRLAGLAASG